MTVNDAVRCFIKCQLVRREGSLNPSKLIYNIYSALQLLELKFYAKKL